MQPLPAERLPAVTGTQKLWVAEHELFGGTNGGGSAPVHTVGLVPVHPASEGISSWIGASQVTCRMGLRWRRIDQITSTSSAIRPMKTQVQKALSNMAFLLCRALPW